MIKFVNGTYGAGHSAGGMIGYVMDGNIPTAVRAIKKQIDGRRNLLHIIRSGDYSPSPLMPNYADNGETRHQRTAGEFVIYHLLLPLN